MAVGGVFAKTDVGNNEERGKAGTEKTDGLNDWTLGVVGCSTEGIFDIRRYWDAEKDYGAEAFLDERFKMRDESIDAAAMLIRKRGDKCLFFSLVGYKQRVDEH